MSFPTAYGGDYHVEAIPLLVMTHLAVGVLYTHKGNSFASVNLPYASTVIASVMK